MICGNLTYQDIVDFENKYLKIIKYEFDRKYPRTSKTPFTKWYVKSYSASARYAKLLRAIRDGKTNTLDKNLKLKVKDIKIFRLEIL